MGVEWMGDLLGLSKTGQDIGIAQALLRAVAVYFFTLLMLKFGKRRMMGKSTPFDIVILIILGSVISRAINGSAAFFPSLAAAAALTWVHGLLAWATARSEKMANAVEGKSVAVFHNGAFDHEAMRKHDLTEKDVVAALRYQMLSEDLSKVRAVVLETNGELTVVRRQAESAS